MWKKIAAAALAAALMLSIAGCGGDSLAGKTLYYVSPYYEDLTTIAFSEGGAAHMTKGTEETMGAWYEEDGNVVVTMGSGLFSSTFTLAPDGEGGWEQVNDSGRKTYYPTEDRAREWAEGYRSEKAAEVQAILEGNEWVWSSLGNSNVAEPAEISFSDGVMTYRSARYTEAPQGFDESAFWANDHSSPYVIEIEIVWETTSGSPFYEGTIEIDGEPVSFTLKIGGDDIMLGVAGGFNAVR